MWTRVHNEGMVWINAAMVTQVKPIDEHQIEIRLACGTKHKLEMTCAEFLACLGTHDAPEHSP